VFLESFHVEAIEIAPAKNDVPKTLVFGRHHISAYALKLDAPDSSYKDAFSCTQLFKLVCNRDFQSQSQAILQTRNLLASGF
jgi:hypothetical protein